MLCFLGSSITRFHNFCDAFEEHNENDKNAVVIIWNDCVSKKIVGYVRLNWSKVAYKFLQFTNDHIRVEATGKESILVLDWNSKYL